MLVAATIGGTWFIGWVVWLAFLKYDGYAILFTWMASIVGLITTPFIGSFVGVRVARRYRVSPYILWPVAVVAIISAWLVFYLLARHFTDVIASFA